jgi:predicted MFS family arabinose efflux permease
LYLARVIDGCTAGNLSIAQAYISDVTKPENRTRAFGFIGIAFGTGFLLGPAISGFLARRFDYSAPAFGAAGLSALSIILTASLLPGKHVAKHSSSPRRRLDLGRYFRQPGPRKRLLEFFAFTMSFSTVIGGLALYLNARFEFDVERTGYVYALSGLVGAIIQGGISRLARSLGEARLSFVGFASMAIGYMSLGAARIIPVLIAIVAVASFGAAVTRPSLTTLLTKSVGPDEQGALLGTSQSLAGISQIAGPVIAGWLIGRGQLAAYGLVAGGFALLGALLVRLHHGATDARGTSDA